MLNASSNAAVTDVNSISSETDADNTTTDAPSRSISTEQFVAIVLGTLCVVSVVSALIGESSGSLAQCVVYLTRDRDSKPPEFESLLPLRSNHRVVSLSKILSATDSGELSLSPLRGR